MNRFLVFAWEPIGNRALKQRHGGWDDYIGSFATEEEARTNLFENETNFISWHVVDSLTGRIILRYDNINKNIQEL